MEILECIDEDASSLLRSDRCGGQVAYRMALSPSGRSFPRCEAHWEARLQEEEQLRERLGAWDSDVPPPWFDPTAAGESWDDE